MSRHSKSKSKPKRTSSDAHVRDRAASPEKVARALVEAVVDQVAAAFTPED
jgi:hypothetical protein